MLHVKFENCRCNSFIEKKMFEYLFSSVDGRCMTHDAQQTLCYAPLKITGNLQIICVTPHHSLTICKVSASLDQNCKISYPETNKLKNLIKGLLLR